jgi:hypothetical protein
MTVRTFQAFGETLGMMWSITSLLNLVSFLDTAKGWMVTIFLCLAPLAASNGTRRGSAFPQPVCLRCSASPKVEGQTAPKAILSGPYGKSRLPAMPEELPSFSWEEVFKYAVAELDLPSREERRERIEEFLERFQEMVGESK